MPAHITWLLLGAAILIAALPGGESSHNCPKSKACCKDSESCCGDWCCPKARHTCVGVTCIPTQTLMTHMAIGQAAGRRAGRPMLFPPFANGQGFPQMERRIPSDLPKVNKKHKVELITKMNLTGPISGPCNNYEIEKVNEGHYLHVYKDPLGIPTIGVGFNLKKSGARKKITDVGANYDLVLAGKQDLTEAQVRTLFDWDMTEATACAVQFAPKLSSVSSVSGIADMAFNMGCAKLHKFVCLRNALSRSPPDVTWAAQEMRSSAWCRQVKSRRCGQDVQCVLNN